MLVLNVAKKWILLYERCISHDRHSQERRNELKPVRDFISVDSFFSVFRQLFTCVHMNWGEMKLKPVWIPYPSFRPKWKFQIGMRFSCEHNLPEAKWISVNLFDIVFNEYVHLKPIAVILTEMKFAYVCPSKYQVLLKCSWNETSCQQNLFSRRLEISNGHKFISRLFCT